jgi:hypothetical protein
MVNAQTTAEDIVLSLFQMDSVDEVELVMNTFEQMDEKCQRKFAEELKERYEWMTADEAREAFQNDAGG